MLKTKISHKRNAISVPVRKYMNDKLINKEQFILDYGCGRGDDVNRLRTAGYDIIGYDKYIITYPEIILNRLYDVVMCNYVFNTIENPQERALLVQELTRLGYKVLIAVRSDFKAIQPSWKRYSDGFLTTFNTFQKFYTLEDVQQEFTINGYEPSIIHADSSNIIFELVKGGK